MISLYICCISWSLIRDENMFIKQYENLHRCLRRPVVARVRAVLTKNATSAIRVSRKPVLFRVICRMYTVTIWVRILYRRLARRYHEHHRLTTRWLLLQIRIWKIVNWNYPLKWTRTVWRLLSIGVVIAKKCYKVKRKRWCIWRSIGSRSRWVKST